MGRDKKNEQRQEQWTKWIKSHRELPAWKALSFAARVAYFHIRVLCLAETAQKKKKVRNNNGEIYRSSRELADDMGCSVKAAMRALADLQAKGWIVMTEMSCLGVEGKGKAPKFRLTMMSTGDGLTFKAATQEPKRWSEGHDYHVPVYSSNVPKPRKGRAENFKKKKRNPVS